MKILYLEMIIVFEPNKKLNSSPRQRQGMGQI